jgi:hypothetical protein
LKLSERQIAEYFHRSYSSVDGLWFMKVEEKYQFNFALEIDNEVWKVLPKIQARMLKTMGKMEDGIKALFECFTAKHTLEGFDFTSEYYPDESGFQISIRKCPWYDLMVKSGRKNLSGQVGTRICNTEYSVWATEFGKNISFELKEQICQGAEFCLLQFDCRK